jgi:hypothetical protein
MTPSLHHVPLSPWQPFERVLPSSFQSLESNFKSTKADVFFSRKIVCDVDNTAIQLA